MSTRNDRRHLYALGYAAARRRMSRELEQTADRIDGDIEDLRGELRAARAELVRLRTISASVTPSADGERRVLH